MLEFVIKELKDQGFKDVFLWVLEENFRARKFYENNGFVYDGDYINDKIGGKKLREVKYSYKFT